MKKSKVPATKSARQQAFANVQLLNQVILHEKALELACADLDPDEVQNLKQGYLREAETQLYQQTEEA